MRPRCVHKQPSAGCRPAEANVGRKVGERALLTPIPVLPSAVNVPAELLLIFEDERDLKQFWPELTGDKQAPAGGIVGNAV